MTSNRNQQSGNDPSGSWTAREAYLLAMVCLLAGLAFGYVFRGPSTPPSTPPLMMAAANQAPPDSTQTTPSPEAVKPLAEPLLAILRSEPNNLEILVQLGNLYYDHHVYPDAIEHYCRALELRPNDYNVRTDLGTAYWYSGSAEKAVAEYQKALAVKPAYAPTLMNLGIVRLDGLKDAAGAIAAWQELLKSNPAYPEKQRVLDLLARAQAQSRN